MKVLLCENDKNTVEDIRLIFNLDFPRYNLIITNSSNCCIDIIKEENPDIYIIDLDTVNIHDFQLVKRIRDISDNPIIILSSKYNDTELIEIVRAGADRYIQKPINRVEFMARLITLTGNKSR
jgi:two-component system KDP operon response regulator KdpE